MCKKIYIIHPVDSTTDFLKEIYNDIENTKITVLRIESKDDHFSFYENSPEENTVLFLGHGTSNTLKGASTIDYDGILMSENQINILENKNVILFSCRSNQYINKFYKSANLKNGIGFPNMITDYVEISEYDEPERAAGLTSEDIEKFKIIIVDIMKFSLKDFIELNLNIFQLYNRIKLRINKAILDYFKENNNDDPLGKMLIDLRNGIVIKKN